MGATAHIRVFVVDDQETVRRATVAHLRSFDDIEVIGEASDGSEAVMTFRALSPDVILMDVVMPGMNGIETTRRVLAADPAAKVIMVSALATAQHLAACRELGAFDFISKEQIPTELVPSIRRAASAPVRPVH